MTLTHYYNYYITRNVKLQTRSRCRDTSILQTAELFFTVFVLTFSVCEPLEKFAKCLQLLAIVSTLIVLLKAAITID